MSGDSSGRDQQTLPMFFMIITKIYKIKPDKLGVWRNWCQRLQSDLRLEALETLKVENAELELFINLKLQNNWYALGLMSSKNNLETRQPDNSKINQEHKLIKSECLEPAGESEIGYLLKI